MSFPNRVTRSQLGPRFRDVYPIENPETDIGEQQFNDLFDQVAGMNVIVPRVALAAKRAGAGAFDVYHQAEAWNPDGGQAHPVLAEDPSFGGTGRYIYTFAPTYLDGEGQPTATALGGLRIWTFGAPVLDTDPGASNVDAQAWFKPSDPLVVKIAIYTRASGFYIDVPFWLEVL